MALKPTSSRAGSAGRPRVTMSRAGVVLAVLTTIVVALAAPGSFLEQLDRRSYDALLRRLDAHQPESSLSSSVVLIDVEPGRLEQWRRGDGGSRKDLAKLLLQLGRRHPAAIVVDTPFLKPSSADEVLAAACLKAKRVVLRVPVQSPRPTSYEVLGLPSALYATASGYVLWANDPDGVVRRFALGLPGVDSYSIPWVAYQLANGRRPPGLTREAEVLLHFRGPHGTGFTVYPTDQIEHLISLRGKVVIIGSTNIDEGGFTTPLATSQRAGFDDRRPQYMSSSEVLANAVDTLLSGRPPVEETAWLLPSILLMALLGGLLAGLRFWLAGIGWLLLLCATWWVGADLMVGHYGLVLAWVPPPLAAVLSFAACFIQRLVGHLEELGQTAREAEGERRRLAELDQAKRAVLGTVVHDLRNPITVIKGQAMTLLSDPQRELGDDLHQEFLENISHQCDRLVSLAEDLLDTDPQRRIALHRQPTDLARLTAEIAEQHQQSSPRHQLVVEADDLGLRSLDREKLARVLHNLIGNAIKYSPDGGRVTIGLHARDDGGLDLSVADEGLGLRPEQVEQLFGLFVRVLDRPEDIPGTGVGLFSVKRLVEAHGGQVEVASEPGHGSTFTCHLPPDPDEDEA